MVAIRTACATVSGICFRTSQTELTQASSDTAIQRYIFVAEPSVGCPLPCGVHTQKVASCPASHPFVFGPRRGFDRCCASGRSCEPRAGRQRCHLPVHLYANASAYHDNSQHGTGPDWSVTKPGNWTGGGLLYRAWQLQAHGLDQALVALVVPLGSLPRPRCLPLVLPLASLWVGVQAVQ
jgi:hypothetical protein